MSHTRRVIAFINVGHALDHLFMLIYTTAVLTMAVRRHDIAVAVVRGLGGDEAGQPVAAVIIGRAQHVRFATELGLTS